MELGTRPPEGGDRSPLVPRPCLTPRPWVCWRRPSGSCWSRSCKLQPPVWRARPGVLESQGDGPWLGGIERFAFQGKRAGMHFELPRAKKAPALRLVQEFLLTLKLFSSPKTASKPSTCLGPFHIYSQRESITTGHFSSSFPG